MDYRFPFYLPVPMSIIMQRLKKEFEWVRDMESTPQDKEYHAEGDVYVHTEMVLKSLIELPEFKKLDYSWQHILFAAALFHDVEKRSTTKEENGRIISPGHAKKGEITTRTILYKDFENMPFNIREQVAKLVRHHGLPLWIFEKQNPQKSIIESSLMSNNEMISVLAKADVLGRICNDAEDLLYRIELFKAYAEEQKCLNHPKYFPDEYSRGVYFQREESSPDYEAFNDTKCSVVLMSGLPGAGKDHYIKSNYGNVPVISLDKIRRDNKIKPGDKYATGYVVQLAKEQARVYLRNRESFIWNGTNTTKQIREQVISLFKTYGAHVTIKYIETPYKTLISQNKNREFPIKEDVLERFISKLEVPSIVEAHEVKYIISGKEQTIQYEPTSTYQD